MTTDHVRYSRRGPLAVICLQRPEALNALTLDMIAAIERCARQADADPEVFALCITGEGRGFCSGIDMSVLADHAQNGPPAAAKATDGAKQRPALFSFLLDVSKPVIAAINGIGAGGGFVLALMSDLRFMADDATLTTVFSRRGLIAEHGTSWLLPRMIGLSRSLDLLWSSRKIDAAEAYRLGLADRVVPAAQLLDAVEEYVAQMAATVSPRALAVIKAQVHRQLSTTFDEAALECAQLMDVALRHPDATEGALSFIERRPVRFAPWKGGQP